MTDKQKYFWIKLATVALLVAFAYYSRRQQELPTPNPPREVSPESPSATLPESPPKQRNSNDRGPSAHSTIAGITVRNDRGQVVFRGNVDVSPTLQRISQGEKLRFRNDGSVFENRERKLPPRRRGYYREYVHPTPSLSGPGPQRLVLGESDEVYYTHDHYRTFERLDDAPSRGPPR